MPGNWDHAVYRVTRSLKQQVKCDKLRLMLTLEDCFVLPFSLRLRVIIVFPIVSRLPVPSHTHSHTHTLTHPLTYTQKTQNTSLGEAAAAKRATGGNVPWRPSVLFVTLTSWQQSPYWGHQHNTAFLTPTPCVSMYARHILVFAAEQRTVHHTKTYPPPPPQTGFIFFSLDYRTGHLVDICVGINPELTNFI